MSVGFAANNDDGLADLNANIKQIDALNTEKEIQQLTAKLDAAKKLSESAAKPVVPPAASLPLPGQIAPIIQNHLPPIPNSNPKPVDIYNPTSAKPAESPAPSIFR